MSQCGASHHLLAIPDPLRALEPVTLAVAGGGQPSKTLQGFVKEPSVQPDLPVYPFHAFLSKWQMFPRHTPRAFAGLVSFFLELA